MAASDWGLSDAQQANLGMGANPFLGSGGSPYLQSMIDQSSQDVVQNYNLTQQPAFNAAMVNSGSFGNEGVNQMNQQAQNMLQKNLGQLSTGMRQQDYTNQQNQYQWQQGLLNQQNQFQQNFGENQREFNLGFGRSTFNDAYSQNMNNLTTGMGLLGNMYGYTGSDITNAGAMQNTPMDYWTKFSNAANSLGQGYGTDTSVRGTTSNPLMGALGGAQLGSSAYNWWNKNNPSSTPAPSYGTDNSNFGSNLTQQTGDYNTGSFY